MQTDWQGDYLDGKSAVRRRVTVSTTPAGLTITTEGGERFQWPYDRLRQTQGFYPGDPVRLEKEGADPEAVVLPDAAFLRALHRLLPEQARPFHDPDRRPARSRLTFLAAFTSIAAAASLYLWGIPALAALIAARVPISWEAALGRSTLERLAPAGMRCVAPKGTEMIDRIMKPLIGSAPSPYSFQVIVVDHSMMNAFALPGGTIVVFRGLLAETKRPEALAGVLAHEIAHISERHTTRALLQQASTGLLLSALTGNAGGVASRGLEGAQLLGLLRYNRQNEEEADRYGMERLLKAGIDPEGMIGFFETLREKEEKSGGPPVSQYLSTHPATEDRIERLRSMAKDKTKPVGPLLPGEDWNEVKKICEVTAGAENALPE